MSIPVNISGQRFGKLVASHPLGADPDNGKTYWHCGCDCGRMRQVRTNDLRQGKAKSCGESSCTDRGRPGPRMSYTSTYHIWAAMIQRCTNPQNKNWKDYGGRGIAVCDSWLQFENFLGDMGVRPDGLTLDRENNNLGYSKDNCRWATYSQQAYNRRPKVH